MHTRARVAHNSNQDSTDVKVLPPTLPTARSAGSDAPSQPDDRLWSLLFLSLQSLSVLPSLAGFAYSCHRFFLSPSPSLLLASSTWVANGSARGVTEGRSTKLDWFVTGLWALACAYFNHSLAKGLLRRWFVYYSLLPTVIRVITLQAICWPLILTTHRILSFDQPVAAWLVCATSAALSNIVQIWVTSNIATVERKDRRGNPSWRWLSLAISAVVGPGVRTEKLRKNERALSWKKVLWGTVFPFAILGWITTTALLWQQYVARYQGGGGVNLSSNSLSPNYARGDGKTLIDLNHQADVRVVMLVTSSWTNRSLTNRHNFRQSTALLIPSTATTPSISIAYRFLLGTAPSPQVQARSGEAIEAEAKEFGDLLIVPAHDGYNQLSKKIYEGWKWASHLDVDYVLKTDDDMFLRMDVISNELIELGRRREYWRGFAYWAIPAINDASNKNADFSYELASFPPYTAGALHILSHDLVALITPPSASRLFVMNEDQNLGLWLYSTGIRPIHDHRIQQGQICENDMIAKHFGYKEEGGIGPIEMYQNVKESRSLCSGGFLTKWCGVCYPACRGRDNHWRDWGFSCDPIKGATLSNRPATSSSLSTLDSPVKALPEPFIMGSSDDPWVIPGLLSRHSSPFSHTDDWHLLHMLCWTTGAETFQERHYQAMETIWAHEPRAILFMMSTSLPLDFFQMYTDHGYAIHVVRIGSKELLERGWFLGPNSERWLTEWDRWSEGPNFFSHLTDYLRYLFLFKFGGTYLDMDAPWVRSPPNSNVEFIGADYSTVASDLDWTLDDTGMYLAPGVMRFKKGWNLFKEIMESAFSLKYSAACFNCVGPKAITIHAKASRRVLELNGFTILPSRVLYPKNWQTSHELVVPLEDDSALVELKRIIEGSWSIHLFGKMTNHLKIDEKSIVGEALEMFSLKIPRRVGFLSSRDKELGKPSGLGAGLELRFPKTYQYKSRSTLMKEEVMESENAGSLNGRFEGMDILFVRAAKFSRVSKAEIGIRVREGSIAMSSSSGRLTASNLEGNREGEIGSGKEIKINLENVTVKDVNTILGSFIYVPSSSNVNRSSRSDSVGISVTFGKEVVQGNIDILL